MDKTILELGNFYLKANDQNTEKYRLSVQKILDSLRTNYLFRCLPVGTYDYSAVSNGFGRCKTLWCTKPHAYVPMILAMTTGDGRFATMARYMAHYRVGYPSELQYGSYLSIRFSDKMRTLKPAPLPNRYIVKDDPVRGIRILDDNFACVFSCVHDASTIIGARTAQVPDKRDLGWNGLYGTVLQAVAPEVGRVPWKFEPDGQCHARSARRVIGCYATFNDRCLSSKFAAFSVSYRLEGAKKSEAKSSHPWQVHQIWFYAHKTMFGLIKIVSLENQKAPYVGQCIQFNHVEEIRRTDADANAYEAGAFSVRILETNFPLNEITRCRSYIAERFYEEMRGREIRLTDAFTDNADSHMYPAGHEFTTLLSISSLEGGTEQIHVKEMQMDDSIGMKISFGEKAYLVAYRIRPGVGKMYPQEMNLPLTAAFWPGERQKEAWYDRRHPSREPDTPEKFYFNLPQYAIMLLAWETKE